MIDTEHRRNLYRIIIGAIGVTLAGKLNDLDGQVRAKNTDTRDSRNRMQRQVPPGMTIESFVALPEDAEIDSKIAAKEQELQAVQRAGAASAEGRSYSGGSAGFPGGLCGASREDLCETWRAGCRAARGGTHRWAWDAGARRGVAHRGPSVCHGGLVPFLQPGAKGC